ncbi:MAG: dienelactone hydrolase family protein [Actinomycetia bacterium]|nr:dienelactone hydrolase family protein [Actinomycetes bacterium]
MTTVVLFHSVLGVRQGVLDAADRLRGDGHDVHIPDLFGGRTFDEYDPAMDSALKQTGFPTLLGKAVQSVAEVPDGFVVAGFSLGCAMAGYVATQRQVSGVLMIAGAIPVSGFGAGVTWPSGVPAQTHATLDDPWREQEEIDDAVREVEAGGGTIEVFDYPGSGHLFTDPTLPDEYDANTTELFWSRALPFVAACGAS